MPASFRSVCPLFSWVTDRAISSEKVALRASQEAGVAYRVGVWPRARHRVKKAEPVSSA
jgi:hypothetical protein